VVSKGRETLLMRGVCKSLKTLQVRKWSYYTTFGVVYMVALGRGLVAAQVFEIIDGRISVGLRSDLAGMKWGSWSHGRVSL